MSLQFEYPLMAWAIIPVVSFLILMLWNGWRFKDLSWPRWILVGMGLGACVLGLMRPQMGAYSTSQSGLRGDLYIAIDISNSMRAEDAAPSRLEFSTAFARRLLGLLPGIRVAVFPFAADGYLQMPLSTDVDAAIELTGSLTPSITTAQGTDYQTSLETLWAIIQKSRNSEPAPARVVLISDGETHESIASSLLKKFRSQSIPIDTVGVGTREGAFIPVEGKFGIGRENLRDENGKPVRTQLVTQTLQKIAEESGGLFYPGRFEESESLATRISRGMEFGKLHTDFKVSQELFPWLFLVALVCFLIEFSTGRWHYLIRLVPLVCLLPSPGQAWDEETEQLLLKASGPQRPFVAYNEGVKRAEQGQFDQAAELFQEAASTATDLKLKKNALYNLGNALTNLSDTAQALMAYQKAYDTTLKQSSSNEELNTKISENMVLTLQKQKQQQQSQGQSGEGEGQDASQPQDPGKAKQFKSQTLDENQKKKLFDLVTSEEQQVLQKLQRKQTGKGVLNRGKTW